MKKIIKILISCMIVISLISLSVFLFRYIWIINYIDTDYLGVAKFNNELYIKTRYPNIFHSIDPEKKTFRWASKNEIDASLFETNDQSYFKHSFFAGAYDGIVADGYEGVIPHIESLELENKRSVVDACGYTKDELLVGFVQVYKKTRGFHGNYSIEEIDHSILFSYDAENDMFTVEHTLDDVVIVAFDENSVIYWRDRAFYLYNLETKEEKFLVDHKSYDAGITQYSSSGVYSNSEMCVLYLSKRPFDKEFEYMYVYDWSTGDFFELAYQE